MLAAKNAEPAVGPMARLSLIAMGDSYAWTGPHFDVPERVHDWTRQGWTAVADGLDELAAAHLIYVDEQHRDPSGAAAVWLAFVAGWERDWEDDLWARFPVERRPIPTALRRAVMERDGGRCRQCGTADRPTIDHVHPVSRGGLTVLASLQVLCARHNSIKSARVGVTT